MCCMSLATDSTSIIADPIPWNYSSRVMTATSAIARMLLAILIVPPKIRRVAHTAGKDSHPCLREPYY